MGLMLGVIVPASMKLAAPLACPNGYVRTAVVVETSTTSEGNTTSGTLYCIDAAGVLVHANPLVAFLGLGLEVGVALLAVAALLRVSAFVRGDTQ
jgi:uncharacterized membrane protein HdeD (DUF308 family)